MVYSPKVSYKQVKKRLTLSVKNSYLLIVNTRTIALQTLTVQKFLTRNKPVSL